MARNLALAAIILWNTSYPDMMTDSFGKIGGTPDPGLMPFISPTV